MEQKIEAKEEVLGKVFGDDYSFHIPHYQRPYAWTEEQAGEMLADFTAAMENQQNAYFLGSIVLIKEPGQSQAEVIDGQQRLTTLTILFCALRELSEDDDMKDGLNNRIRAKGDVLIEQEIRFRLRVRDRDNDFFERNIQQDGALGDFVARENITRFTDSQTRMYENARCLWAELKEMDASERDQLTRFLAQHCYLVVVSASDRKSAHRIFSVLNTRGLDLSVTDILKADIISALPEDEHEDYTDKWESIEEMLGREDFRDLFTHIRMIRLKAKAQRSLEEDFQESILRQATPDDFRSFMDDTLAPMAEAYQIVSKAAYQSAGGAEQVNGYLRHLGRLDNHDWMPPALAYFDKHKDDQEALLRFVRDLERLAYCLFVLRKNVNGRISRYGKVLQEIEKGEDLNAENSALQLSDEEKADAKQVLDGPFYRSQVCKLLLLRLDVLFAEKGAIYVHEVVSVEHVLPQNPAEGSEWSTTFTEEDRQYWTHRLANLVLLSQRKNSRAGNFDFGKKKDEYFQKGKTPIFALTVQVIKETSWTPAILQERQKLLIERLVQEWRL